MTNRIFNPATLCLGLALLLAVGSTAVNAAVLTGMGPNLPIPTINPPWPPGVVLTRVAVTGGFTGTWLWPAQPDWIGTFNATGPIPNITNSGTTLYDFSGLPTGKLPAGTFFIFGDVDGGSQTNEIFDLTAFDGSGNPLLTWLDDTFAVTGTGTGTAGAILPGNMPGWDWDVTTTDTYRIDGLSVTGGNPSVAFALVSNQPIVTMTLVKGSTFNSFGLQAPPVPEPGAMTLCLVGLLGLLRRNRREAEDVI